MTVREQHLEGQLRFVNSRVITNRCVRVCASSMWSVSHGGGVLHGGGVALHVVCLMVGVCCTVGVCCVTCPAFCVYSEEISFYQGSSRERVTMKQTFEQLVRSYVIQHK